MKAYAIAGLIVFMSAVTLPGFARTINQRQDYQHARIENGVLSGSLTHSEFNNLHQQERSLDKKEDRYRADGNLSRAERRDLQKSENRLSHNIYDQEHDGQRRNNDYDGYRTSYNFHDGYQGWQHHDNRWNDHRNSRSYENRQDHDNRWNDHRLSHNDWDRRLDWQHQH